jgi:hypothetical protein
MAPKLQEVTMVSTRIRVAAEDAAEATREAASLRKHLLDEVASDLSIELVKENANTQDMGATLVLALGTPTAIAVAQGIADWIRARRIGSAIELEIGGNKLRVTGEIADDPNRLVGIVAALQGKA